MQMHVHNQIIAKQWLVCTLTFRQKLIRLRLNG